MPELQIEVEDIPDTDLMSRHIVFPQHYSVDERKLMAIKVFEFPSADGQRESFVWRKYKPTIDEVHALGCARQWVKRAMSKPHTYEGARTAKVENVRQIQSILGSGFLVRHAPEEGIHHAEVAYRVPDGHTLTGPEKLDLKQRLLDALGPLEAHVCGDVPTQAAN